MNIELDRYYTPSNVADIILDKSSFSRADSCVDSTCGSGNLLSAATRHFGTARCIGLDQDKRAIAKLRKENPDWILSTANLLNKNSYIKTLAFNIYRTCDLLVLNPPFSHCGKKYIEIDYAGSKLRTSIAMAHIIKSFEIFKPQNGAIIIVPESLLYSETDSSARKILADKYQIKEILELECTTFRGARVHSVAIEILSGASTLLNKYSPIQKEIIRSKFIRGNLPVYKKQVDDGGTPYIHSTDLKNLIYPNSLSSLIKVKPLGDNLIKGHVILFPRVGVPKIENIIPIEIKDKTQLSDCVLSLVFEDYSDALEVEKRIKSKWEGFLHLYRGTGARYTTTSRMIPFLNSIGITTI